MQELIDRYKIVKKISENYLSVTYEAHDPGTGRFVAIKYLNESGNADAEEEFIKETRVVGRLNHQNIVSIFDVGEHEGRAFIAMELLKGDSLEVLMAEHKQYSWSIVANVAKQIASALEYAHNQGVIHGDIRPGNIIWNRDDNKVILTDFSNGKQLTVYDTATLKVSKVTRSTPYLSPEIITQQRADHRADLFSLGTVLYQMLTGYPPFIGDDLNELTTQITKRAHKAISVSVTAVPDEFIKIIDKLLYKEPDHRYQNAAALSQDLESLPQEAPLSSPYSGKHTIKIAAGILVAVSVGVLFWSLQDKTPAISKATVDPTEPATTESPTPPVVAIAKPISKKLQMSSLQASINTKLSKFECASLHASMKVNSEVHIQGHVSLEEDMISLMDLMDTYPGLSNVTYEVNAIRWPFCEAIAILSVDARSNISNNAGLRVVNGDVEKQVTSDARLNFYVTSPDYDAYIYVDYYHVNGTVTHLYPSTAKMGSKTNASSKLKVTHKDLAKNGSVFGESLVVVLASYNPLMSKGRPMVEPAQQYLSELHREVVVNKVQLSAAYLMLENLPASNI